MSEKSFDGLLEELASDSEFQQAFMEEDLINRVGLRVLAYRKAEGLAQNELAERTGTRQPAIAKIEAGESNLTLRKLAQLALALQCDPADLICEAEPKSLKARRRELNTTVTKEAVVGIAGFWPFNAVLAEYGSYAGSISATGNMQFGTITNTVELFAGLVTGPSQDTTLLSTELHPRASLEIHGDPARRLPNPTVRIGEYV